ncbi:hypothetical protein N7528_009011 [Penicillium herquei]|nr:hypothetical protein N7528_009011 [Penicillium herquei]
MPEFSIFVGNVAGLVYLAVAMLPLWYLASYLISPLRQYPGPFLAGWTNLWRMFHVRRGKYHFVMHELHKKYGPVVRIAPNVLDLDIPELIKTIYNTKENYIKTEFYHGSSALNNGKIIYNLFSECNPAVHSGQKRPVSKYFSLNGIVTLEPHIDKMIQYFCQRLDEKFVDGDNSSEICDLGEWISFCTWDVVGQATFSQPIGYLEKGYDFDNTLKTANIAMDYFTLVGQMPILDRLLDKNPVYRLGPPSFGTITNISIQHLVDRLQGSDAGYHDPAKPDFLDKFIQTKENFPDTVDDTLIISWLMVIMIAGADTTAITLNAALYSSLKQPSIWQRLRSEIPTHDSNSSFSATSYKDSRNFPSLNAVVCEALRRYVPAGCVVGINPYVVGRNKSVFGENADTFRPERWLRDEKLETEEEFQQRLHLMNNTDLAFGGGSRICIGKHLAPLEVHKVLATLISRYDIAFVDPTKEWETHNSFFVRQSGIKVKLSSRT